MNKKTSNWIGPLVLPALALGCGIIGQHFWPVPVLFTLIAAAAGLAVANVFRLARPAVAEAALLAGIACLGAARLGIHRAAEQVPLAGLGEQASAVRIEAAVIDEPSLLEREHSEPAQACTLRVRHYRGPAGWVRVDARLRATMPLSAGVAYGDSVLLDGEWKLAERATNPGQYDRRAAYQRQGIAGLLTVSDKTGVVRVASGRGRSFDRLAAQCRGQANAALHRMLRPDEADFLSAMVLGERSRLDESRKQAFIETGTMHLLVVSGSNVGVVALLILFLLRPLGLPRGARGLLAAAGLVLYCGITGMQVPVERATLVALLVLGAQGLDRVARWDNLTAAAAIVFFLADPDCLFDPSFQLSFGAITSLAIFTPMLQRAFSAMQPPVFAGMWRGVAQLLAATVAVWIGLWPILASIFFVASPVSLLANLLLGPLVGLVMLIALPAMVISSFVPSLQPVCGFALSLLVRAICGAVEACHALPGGTWWMGHPGFAVPAGYYALIVASAWLRRRGQVWARVALLWLAAGCCLTWASVPSALRQRHVLRMDVLDVGHGDATILRLPDGRIIVIDAGTEAAGRQRVLPFLRHQGINAVDALILTHPDNDHIGGAVPLLEQMPVRLLLTNGAADDTMTFLQIARLKEKKGIPHRVLRRGMRIASESGVIVEVLHPPANWVAGAEPGSNDNALVLRVTLGSQSWLLCADIEEAGIPIMLRQPIQWKANVLKVPHHGSRLGSAGDRLLAAVQPELAIISVGWLHHLPARQTLQALERARCPVLLTRDTGWIRLETDGREWHRCTGSLR